MAHTMNMSCERIDIFPQAIQAIEVAGHIGSSIRAQSNNLQFNHQY